jgi:Ca2+-binding RTX toxin-like protein
MSALDLLPVLVLATGAMGAAPGGVPAAALAVPSCHGEVATIVGTRGADRITGTAGRDVIVARGGDDVVASGEGDDLVCGGDGADDLSGGPGDDLLDGQRDGVGRHRGGSFRVPDELTGGPGADTLDVGGDPRRVDQGGRHGVISYETASGPVQVDLATGTATGAGADRIVDVPGLEVRGSAFGDELAGGPRADHLVGGGGDDLLLGREGDDELLPEGYDAPHRNDRDTVDGGPGADTILARFGRDVLHGGDGEDQVSTWSTKPSEVYGDAGDDWVSGMVTRGRGFVVDGGDGDDRGFLGRPGRVQSGETDPGPTVVVREAEGTVDRDGATIGSLVSVGRLELDTHLRWTYHGTEGADAVSGGYYWRFRAWTYGGDDHVTGSGRRDLIDAGAGHDRVDAQEGRDTCLDAEVVRGCEVLTP